MSAQTPLLSAPGLVVEGDQLILFNKGLRAVAYKQNKQIFLSSRRNFFGGIRYSKVKLDHCANGVLLYFPTVESINDLGMKFSDIEYRITVEKGTGIGSLFNMLVVSHRTTRKFAINLCKDLLPLNKPFPVNKLHFIICKDDAAALFSAPSLEHVRIKLRQTGSFERIESLATSESFVSMRRSYVLVGQELLEDLSLHEHGQLHIAYDHDFKFSGNYDHLCHTIRDQLRSSSDEETELFYTELAEEPNRDAAWVEASFAEEEGECTAAFFSFPLSSPLTINNYYCRFSNCIAHGL